MNECVPDAGAPTLQQKALDSAATGKTMPSQPRWKDAGVVQHDEVAAGKKAVERRASAMSDAARLAVQHHQPRPCPLGRRMLRDQLGREIEIEIRYEHRPESYQTRRVRWCDRARDPAYM